MVLLEILTIILIVLVAGLCIYLFTTLKKLNRSIDVLSADMHRLIDSTIPLIDNLKETSKKLNNIATDAEHHMADFNHLVSTTKEKVSSISTKVKEGKSQNPVLNLVNNLNAISKGISSFWQNYKS